MTKTLEEPQVMEGFSESDIWCLERQDNPTVALCGRDLWGPIIPRQEVPEEQLCPECVRLHGLGVR